MNQNEVHMYLPKAWRNACRRGGSSALSLFSLCVVFTADDVLKGEFGAAAPAPRPSAGIVQPAKRKTYPFSGTLEASDPQSITLKGKRKIRVLLVTPQTRIEHNGRKGTLAEARPGDRVSGSARKNAEEKEEALTIHLGKEKEKPK
ncbi:MAG TPA: hypothetical protein VK633_01485 [Verrucomicrobiae bacterium]|nr:hypothetical protein [Verrucomicrobiae bacterium]